jgi:uncharacterized repeat protein (TIGR04076 family)
MIPDFRITVLRRFHPDEVFGESYPIEKQDWMNKCDMLENGQEFIVHEMEMPEGFCSGAWTTSYPHLRMLAFRGNMSGTEEGLAFVSCNDGLSPVLLKIVRT